MKRHISRLVLMLCAALLPCCAFAKINLGLPSAVKATARELREKIVTPADIPPEYPPVIASLSANPAVISTGAATTITCAASDRDGDSLAYTWSAASGTVSGSGPQITWTAPSSSGTYAVTCTVSDGRGGIAFRSVNVPVVTANIPPVISSLSADPAGVHAGAATTITCAATDADGDPLVYNWSAASGTITGTGAAVVWTAPPSSGTYTITCAVSDGRGGSAQSGVNVTAANQDPVISSLIPNPASIAPGTTTTITVTASDADGDTLSYSWSAASGTITGVGAQVTWTAPWSSGTYTITCAVSDGKGGVAQSNVNVGVISIMKWAFTTGNWVASSPAIDADGTVYLGSLDTKLYAINPDGTQKWAFTTGGAMNPSPAIGADGTVYAVGNANLYAIYPNGIQKWVFTTGNTVDSSPSIGADGTVYLGSLDSKLYAVNPDGTQKWAFATSSYVYSSPAIGTDGTIYVGSDDFNLYAINPDGTQKWAFTTSSAVVSSPAIGADGTVYVGSYDNKLYAINTNGTQKWAFTTGNLVDSSPSIGADGTVYVGSVDSKLYAINPDGTQKWLFTAGGAVRSPAIGANGTVYVGAGDFKFYAVNPDGTQKWVFTLGDWTQSPVAIGADGTVYIGSFDGKLYALYGNTPLASSAWPKFHRDPLNTGRQP